MKLSKRAISHGLAVLMAVGLCGCLPSGSNPLEEQKEPHYLEGLSRVNSLDFHGAVESFLKALDVNPRSASAHFQLGWLYEEKAPDPAAAIYHYERYLKLRPNADNASLVKQRVYICKQELAKAVLPLPVTPGLQREFEQLAMENKRLKEELARWQAYAARLPMSSTNASTPVLVMTHPATVTSTTTPPVVTTTVPVERPPASSPVVRTRTHTVKAGENPYSIARQSGISLNTLLAANPGVNPKRLQVGHALVIPKP